MPLEIHVKSGLKFLALCLIAGVMGACSHRETTSASSSEAWDPKAAAVYLDQREVTWTGWIGAARDHGTFCVACHTTVPYVLARPVLRRTLAEDALSVNERRLLDNVTRRVQLWNTVGPYYADEGYGGDRVARSRGTEAVLNAFILASYDAQNGRLSDVTQAAFNNMWALQLKEGDDKGAWFWLQFGMEPFEAKDSPYYGACLAAIAVGMAPESYRLAPEIQENVSMLRDYLDRKYATQSTINHVVLLWASAKLPGLVRPERQKAIIDKVWEEQRSDGGWNLPSLAYPRDWSLHSLIRKWVRSDGTLQAAGSDGYATSLISFSLKQAGVPAGDPRMMRALSWLARNQNSEGFWPSRSVNLRRNPSSNVGHFMDDAASGFAVLALSGNKVISGNDEVNAHGFQSASTHELPKREASFK
jgi:squalene-hopene/tetraprenyl-beta-curcumene cyclase